MSVPTLGRIRDDSPRAAEWLQVFGKLEVPLKSPIAHRGLTPDGKEAEFYLVDWKALERETLGRVIAFIVEKFKLSWVEALDTMRSPDHGFPILAADVTVSFDGRLVV